MSSKVMTEGRDVGRKKKPVSEPAQERVEFVAPPEWVRRLEQAAGELGLTRSAYIRMACNKLMKADAREERGADS